MYHYYFIIIKRARKEKIILPLYAIQRYNFSYLHHLQHASASQLLDMRICKTHAEILFYGE